MQAIQNLVVILRKCFEGKKTRICIAQSMLKFIRTLYVTFPGSHSEIISSKKKPGSLTQLQPTSKSTALTLELHLF